ncbi:MAG: AAA family ATPase, partial [Polyangiales bacterium]
RNARGDVIALPTRKAEALVALLALTPGQPQGRDKLCGLLWPDVPDTQARHSLRQTVLRLRKVLPDGETPLLQSDARSLQLAAAEVSVDVGALEQAIALGSPAGLSHAAGLYRGELLHGLSIGEAPFEHWLTCERERLRELVVQSLASLVDLALRDQHIDAAAQACARLLQLDPLREAAHRTLMRLHVRQGRRAHALAHYRTLARSLESELGTEPDAETQALRAEIEAAAVHGQNAPAAARESQIRERVAPASEPSRAGSDVAPVANSPGLAPLSAADVQGREHAFAAVLAALPSHTDARSGTYLLLGEAGVGKTYLCDHVAQAARTRGVRVLRGRCFESEQVLPYSLWANLLRDQLDASVLQALAPDLRAELASLLPELVTDETKTGRPHDVRRLFQAMQALMAQLTQPAPLLLVLEDLHWADEMSARLLSYLGRHQSPARPYLMLATARDEDLPSTSVVHATFAELEREDCLQRASLSPLSQTASRALAQQLAAEHAVALDDTWLEKIWAISEGNPLVIVESIRALASGTLAHDVTHLPVPERVSALIRSRVAKVSVAAREVLSFAAVAGRELELDVLRGGLPELPLSAALDELMSAQLVRADQERVYFAHDRIRETLYAQMLPMRRRLLHADVASALERQRAGRLEPVLGHIGYHYSKAGDAPLAIHYLRRFAEHAFRGHGVGEALAALDQASTHCALLPPEEQARTEIDLAIRQAYCLSFLGRFAELITRLSALEAQLERLAAPELAGPFHFFWGFALTLLGETRAADRHAQRALAATTQSDAARVQGYVHTLLAYLCSITGRFKTGLEHGTLAVQLLAEAHDGPEALGIALSNLALNQLWLGDWRAALASAEQADALGRQTNSLRVRSMAANTAGSVYAYIEEWESAVQATTRGLEAGRDPFTLMQALWIAGWAQSGSGKTEHARELLEHVVTQLERHGMRAWTAHAVVILADNCLRTGEAPRALALASRALELARTTDDVSCVGWALRAHGQAALALDQRALARTSLDQSLAVFERVQAPLDIAKSLVELARLAQVEGDAARARAELTRAAELFRAYGTNAALTRSLALLTSV